MTSQTFTSLLELANPFTETNGQAISYALQRWNEVLRLADTNRTLLLLFENLKQNRDAIPGRFWDQLEKQAVLRIAVRDVMASEIAKIQSRLSESGLRCMLIKTIRAFPREIRDLDILLYDEQFEAFRNSLAPLGYRQSGKLSGYKMELRTRREIDGGRKVAVAIDVHSRVSYEGLLFVDEEDMWKKHLNARVNDAVVPIPSPEYQLVTTVLNSFFGDGGLRLTDVFEFGHLLQTGARVEEAREVARLYGWKVAFNTFADRCSPYLAFLGLPEGTAKPREQSSLAELPARFSPNSLLRGLLEKAAHDLAGGGRTFGPSWGRITMKFASRLSRNQIRRDSWNQIFKR